MAVQMVLLLLPVAALTAAASELRTGAAQLMPVAELAALAAETALLQWWVAALAVQMALLLLLSVEALTAAASELPTERPS